jgi:hypothetical protein
MKYASGIALALCLTACAAPPTVVPTASEPVRADLTPTPPGTPTPGVPGPGEATAVSVLPGVPAEIQVAFVFDDRLWLWQDGVGVPLTSLSTASAFAFSSDGQQLAFARDDGLWVVTADGASESVLVGSESFMTLPPTDPGVRLNAFGWRPGHSQLLFNTASAVDANQLTLDLYRVDLETLGRDNPAPPGAGGAFWPSLNGRHLALVRAEGLALLDLDTGDLRSGLDYAPVAIGDGVSWLPQPVWLPDSSAVLVLIPDGEESVVWRVPVTGEAEPLDRLPVALGAVLAPDGASVAYTRDDGVWVRTLADQAEAAWAPAGFTVSQWLPDSRRLLVDQTEVGLIFITSAAGEPIRLRDQFISAIRWLNGDAFVYTSVDPTGETLRMAVLDGPEIVIAGPSPSVLPFVVNLPR